MKFLIDAQLPLKLARWLNSSGHDAIHTLDLTGRNESSDSVILSVAAQQERILVTKDTDFLQTWLLRQKPAKLMLITTGNINNRDLLNLFEKNLVQLCSLLSRNSALEMNSKEIIVHG